MRPSPSPPSAIILIFVPSRDANRLYFIFFLPQLVPLLLPLRCLLPHGKTLLLPAIKVGFIEHATKSERTASC